jgi:hypothetical protein
MFAIVNGMLCAPAKNGVRHATNRAVEIRSLSRQTDRKFDIAGLSPKATHAIETRFADLLTDAQRIIKRTMLCIKPSNTCSLYPLYNIPSNYHLPSALAGVNVANPKR